MVENYLPTVAFASEAAVIEARIDFNRFRITINRKSSFNDLNDNSTSHKLLMYDPNSPFYGLVEPESNRGCTWSPNWLLTLARSAACGGGGGGGGGGDGQHQDVSWRGVSLGMWAALQATAKSNGKEKYSVRAIMSMLARRGEKIPIAEEAHDRYVSV